MFSGVSDPDWGLLVGGVLLTALRLGNVFLWGFVGVVVVVVGLVIAALVLRRPR